MFDKLDASRHFGEALSMLRQIEFALFDFRLHADYDPALGARVLETLKSVRDDVALLKYPDYNRLPHSFSHIFAGGYAAGYYSYKWAEVLAADAFAAFEESGIFDTGNGVEISQRRSWKLAAAVTSWKHTSHFVVANQRSMHCFDKAA